MPERSLEAPAPNRKWIADFTYVWTAEGLALLAAVVDLFSRRVAGWSMSTAMTARLIPDALVMAIWRLVAAGFARSGMPAGAET